MSRKYALNIKSHDHFRIILFFFFKQKTAYEVTEGDWNSDVCSSDLIAPALARPHQGRGYASSQRAAGSEHSVFVLVPLGRSSRVFWLFAAAFRCRLRSEERR